MCPTGTHRCGAACLRNDSPASCGTSCTPCPVPASGFATCSGGQCGLGCNADSLLCDGGCAQCAQPLSQSECSGNFCVPAVGCGTGYRMCFGGCVPCPAGKRFCCLEQVDPTPGAGTLHALAVDAVGNPYIAYYSEPTRSLRLARTSGAGFNNIPLHDDAGIGGVSIAVDDAGTAHVAFSVAGTPRSVKFATVPVGGPAATETIETVDYATEVAVSLDESNVPHVVYQGSGNVVRYAVRRSTGWFARDSIADPNGPTVATSAGTVYVLGWFSPVASEQLTLGKLDAGAPDDAPFSRQRVAYWTSSIVDMAPAIAIDRTGAPLFGFTMPSAGFSPDVYLAVLDGGVWNAWPTAQGTTKGNSWLRAFDDGPRMVLPGGRGTYVERATDGGWRVEDIGVRAESVSLGLDSAGKPSATAYDADPSVRKLYWAH
jgi:hypothetical protein